MNMSHVPQSAAEFLALARRLEDERAQARVVVGTIATSIEQADVNEVPDTLRTIGGVHELCDAAGSLIGRRPMAASALAKLAVAAAAGIPAGAYPQWLVTEAAATAWRRVAQAAHYCNDYDAALGALDETDALLATNERLTFDRAIASLVRALVFSDLRRYAEAADLLKWCERVFRSHKDRPLIGHCVLLRARNAYEQHDLVTSATLFERAAKMLKEADDLHHYALALQGSGIVHLDLRQPALAATSLHDALNIFMGLGMHAEIARTKAGIGRVSMADTRYDQARDLFSESRRMFLSLEMPEEAGVVGLELVEAHLALGELFRAAATTEEVLSEFVHANLNHRAQTALSYLREMIARPDAPAAARHVRTYVDSLRKEPERIFAPLRDDGVTNTCRRS